MIKVIKMNKNDKMILKKLLSKSEESRIQHSWEWINSIEKTYDNCKLKYYFVLEDEEIIGGIPFIFTKSKLFGNKLISMPFVDNGGFIGTLKKEEISNLIENVKKDNENIEFIQIRLNSHMKNYKEISMVLKEKGFKKNLERHQFILELKNPEELKKELSKSAKRMIKTAEKNNLILVNIENKKELNNFYKLYFKNMKSFGTPQHPKEFFKNLWEGLYPKNIKGFNCYYGEKHIASMVCYLWKDYVYYIYSFSNPKYLKLGPKDFLYWNFIKWSVENNYKWFDFGQVEINAEEGSHAKGIYNFKNKWGGKIYERPYFNYNFRKENSKESKNKLKKYRKIWSKLPTPLIKAIGPKICSELGI